MKNFAPLAIQNAHSEDSDQTARNAQSDLNLRCAHMTESTFYGVVASNVTI